jgi:hypothetical protein
VIQFAHLYSVVSRFVWELQFLLESSCDVFNPFERMLRLHFTSLRLACKIPVYYGMKLKNQLKGSFLARLAQRLVLTCHLKRISWFILTLIVLFLP